MNILFVKDRLSWPRSSGHDVHTYFMMQALANLGHRIALATVRQRPIPTALEGLDLKAVWHFDGTRPAQSFLDSVRLTRLQERFRSYWGVSNEQIAWVASCARSFEADAVVVVGLSVLPYLAGIDGAQRIWYAADEWALHHFSLVSLHLPSTWKELRVAAIKGLYERAYAGILDRAWVVSERDARAMRWICGARHVDVIANGVDADYFSPSDGPEDPNTCTFWGRLDFAPNVDALSWFCHRVWPLVTSQLPDAQFRIYGFEPTTQVERLRQVRGVSITPDLLDLRVAVCRSQIVVLPFVNGAGIKNKLLEAAALARPIISSKVACNGVSTSVQLPVVQAVTPSSWTSALQRLWANADERQRLGTAARSWVIQHHSWSTAGKIADASLRVGADGIT